MRKSIGIIVIILCAAAFVAFLPARGFAEVRIFGYDVVILEPDSPASTTSETSAPAPSNEAYLVRVRGIFPRAGGDSLELYVGAKRIDNVILLPDGIAFIIHGNEELKALSGKPLLYREGASDIVNSCVTFAPEKFARYPRLKAPAAFAAVERPWNSDSVIGMVFGFLFPLAPHPSAK